MQILKELFGIHSERLQAALGRTTERQRLLSANLANVNTPGYKRRDMDFAIKLSEAQNGLRVGLNTPDPRHIGGAEITDGPNSQAVEEDRSIMRDGNSVDLEREVAALTETQLHYSALSLVSRRYFQGLREVIREGR